MIDYALQVEGQNLVQVVYKSGANRYIGLNRDRVYAFNGTQREFMEAARKIVMKNADGFGTEITYWLRSDDHARLDAIARRNYVETYGYRRAAK